jgi:FixJ family two-component response regulator
MTRGPFIVVVDDDPSVCKALQRLLRSMHMDVQTHGSAEDLLRDLDRRDPDCLILDIRMPGLTGFELHDRLEAMGRRIPTVFITAHEEELQDIRSAKGPEILHKPFEDKALLTAIRRAMAGPDAG